MQPSGFDRTGFDRPFGNFTSGKGRTFLKRVLVYGASYPGETADSPFGLFYYGGEITWIRITQGHTDPETGEWVQPTTEEIPISGRIQDELTGKVHRTNVNEERQEQDGKHILGNRILRTKEKLNVGDQIRIQEDEGDERTTLWVVEGHQTDYNIFKSYLDIDWTGYMLKQVKP